MFTVQVACPVVGSALHRSIMACEVQHVSCHACHHHETMPRCTYYYFTPFQGLNMPTFQKRL
jgi:hypothetical protein